LVLSLIRKGSEMKTFMRPLFFFAGAGAVLPHFLSLLMMLGGSQLPSITSSSWCWQVDPKTDEVIKNEDTPDYPIKATEDCCAKTDYKTRTHTCFREGECADLAKDLDNALKDIPVGDEKRPVKCEDAHAEHHDKMKEAHHGGDEKDHDAGHEEHHGDHHKDHHGKHDSNVVICLSETKHKMPDGMEMDGNPCKEACPEIKPADYGPEAKCELSEEAMKAMGDHHGHHKEHGGMKEEKKAPAPAPGPAPAPDSAPEAADGAPHQYAAGGLRLGIISATMTLLARIILA